MAEKVVAISSFMPLPFGEELRLVGVLERGVPNKECVMIAVEAAVDLRRFAVAIGWREGPNVARVLQNHCYFLTDNAVAGDFLFVNTGPGENRTFSFAGSKHLKPGATGRQYYWGLEKTAFANPNFVPILFEVSAAQVGGSPLDEIKDLPQGGT